MVFEVVVEVILRGHRLEDVYCRGCQGPLCSDYLLLLIGARVNKGLIVIHFSFPEGCNLLIRIVENCNYIQKHAWLYMISKFNELNI